MRRKSVQFVDRHGSPGFGFGSPSPSLPGSPQGGGFSFDGKKEEPESDEDEIRDSLDTGSGKKSKRRTTMCTELSKRYEYRRAFSEVRLLEAMRYVRLEDGVNYNFITAGDVDSTSYLKVVLNQHDLDYLLISTWVMSAEDAFQIFEWYNTGRIRKIDMYFGDIYPNQYKMEWKMIREFYEQHPEAGRVAVFSNHAKIFAGYCEVDSFWFSCQLSCNANTNPRTEQACLQVNRGLCEFYIEYFDGINSFKFDRYG